MIVLGLTTQEKIARIKDYCDRHDIKKVFLLTHPRYSFDCGLKMAEVIDWDNIIMYRYFYRLLQEIDQTSLVVINECLRVQNRYDLTYNCIRHFLNQSSHQLIFQWFPFIDNIEDFMILFDFDTRSRWKREKFDVDLLDQIQIKIVPRNLKLEAFPVPITPRLADAYAKEKGRLISALGIKDPHTIPRNLYLMSGKARRQAVDPGQWYVGRNNRFKITSLLTYRENSYPHPSYTVFEFPHNFIEFADFLALSGQQSIQVLVSDLKVDIWYFERYRQWARRLSDGYASLS